MALDFQLIETLSDLDSLSKKLAGEKILAVDIEADALHHYFPKVCLVQISTKQDTYIIDPLATGGLGTLQPLFAGPRVKKIFHGADYDFRSLFRDFSLRMNNVFDTMVASQFLGEKDVGLAAVLKKRYGVLLNKKYQKANWSKRPLSHNMLLYAAHDTAYLVKLYRELEDNLRSKGRLDWVEEECEILSVQCTLEPNSLGPVAKRHNPSGSLSPVVHPGTLPLFTRFKGARKMELRDLAILEELLQFRENKAMQKDKPSFRLFRNQEIKELVAARPTDLVSLKKIRGLPADFVGRYAQGALKAIQTGLELPADSLPSFPKVKRPPRNPKKEARLKRLKAWRESKARQLEMELGLVCNNALLGTLAEVNPTEIDDLKEIPKMKKWQRENFGKEFMDVLSEIS